MRNNPNVIESARSRPMPAPRPPRAHTGKPRREWPSMVAARKERDEELARRAALAAKAKAAREAHDARIERLEQDNDVQRCRAEKARRAAVAAAHHAALMAEAKRQFDEFEGRALGCFAQHHARKGAA